jgi:hypothetical protein
MRKDPQNEMTETEPVQVPAFEIWSAAREALSESASNLSLGFWSC